MAKVLLVEDDNNLREIYEARLQAEGYDIASARDGEEALVVAKQELPDLVISDVMMPKISGFEMLDILRNTDGLQDVKVIMLTALGQSEDQSRADSLGADRYLVKSQVTLEDIVNAAHDLLAEAGAITATSTAVPAVEPVAPPAAPEPVAAVTPVPEPAAEPVAAAAPVTDTPVIPLASAPPENPEEAVSQNLSMPPTAVSSIPVDDLAAAPAAPAPEPAADPAPVVAPEPVAATPDPTPAPEPIVENTTAPAEDGAQLSSQQEADSVEAQIESFVESQSGQPEVVVEPSVDPEAPAAEPTPEQEEALNDAVTQLSAPAEAAAPAVEAPSRKVITPITPEEPETDLAAMEAAESATPAAVVAVEAPAVEAEPTPGPTPAPAVEATPAPAAAPVKIPAPKTPAADDFDPNSIAL